MIASTVFANDIDLDRAVWDPDYRHDVMRRLKIEAERLARAKSGTKGKQRPAQPVPDAVDTPPRRRAARKLMVGAA